MVLVHDDDSTRAGTGATTAAAALAPPASVAPNGSPAAPPADSLARTAGLGTRTAASVPPDAAKVLVVRGDGPGIATATIGLFVRTGGSWARGATWRGHVGARGWTLRHREGDLRTPVGTFTLSDAGGRRPDPGTTLPYHRSNRFAPTGSGVFGDSLAGSFDYVLAIDFNRHRGVSPLDQTRPLGSGTGGGIWLHVDHGGPTHGCVSVPGSGMPVLLRALSPQDSPVVVMGDKARLST
jgi:L,D-peptidoglycan transpeptidase YkuD (ErfK/YbiS/YcfS/YnhG family)